MTAAAPEIEFLQAMLSDVSSLSTILGRSFFPVNEYVKKALPDTPLMREWWSRVYEEEVSNPSCYPLIALDPSTDTVIGVLTLRLINQNDPPGGFWTKHEWTDDHDKDMWGPPIECQAHYEKKIMQGKSYFLLELMAVDYAYRSRGIGRKLVENACKIADDAGSSIFVQSGSAKQFYLKLNLGFQVEAEPDWNGYQPSLLVRNAQRR